jgi:hypothetical protein
MYVIIYIKLNVITSAELHELSMYLWIHTIIYCLDWIGSVPGRIHGIGMVTSRQTEQAGQASHIILQSQCQHHDSWNNRNRNNRRY